MEVFEIFAFGSDEHVSHDESMVGTSTHDSDLDSVLLIPSCKAVDNVDAVSCVQVINGTFTVDSPDLEDVCQFNVEIGNNE